MLLIVVEVGLPMSKFKVDPTKKIDFRFGFSVESYAEIQNFKSIGAMKLFLWPFENRRFHLKNVSLSHINKNLGETFPQILNYMENTAVFHSRLRSLDPFPDLLES